MSVPTYQPPGVTVTDVSTEMVTPLAPGLPENLLCIVGPALGYQAYAESLTIHSATGVALSNPGVLHDDSLVVTKGGTAMVKDTDYSVAVSTVNGNAITTLTRLPAAPATVSPNGLAEGDTIRVSYRYTSANYFEPTLFQDYNSIVSAYGPALSSVVGAPNPVASSLSLAARIAFENGAGSILAVAVDGSTSWRQGFQDAYAKLVTDYRVSVLVPVFPDSEVASGSGLTSYVTDVRQHIDAAVASGYGRTALVSGSPAYDEIASPFETVAEAVANKRVVAVYPTRFNLFSPDINQTIEVGGQYACAALGGRLVYNSVEQALTRQPVLSFTSIPVSVTRKMTEAFKNNLGGNGVCVIEPTRTGGLRVRHGVTTDMSALTTREITLVRISDVLLQNISIGMDNTGLVGQPIDLEMTTRVKGALMNILEQEVANSTIDAYDSVFVRQQATPSGDPSVIECQFAYRPAVPLNYIQVSFALNMNTGVVAADTTDQTNQTA